MSTQTSTLTEEAAKLLQAVVEHAKVFPEDSRLKVREVLYGFQTNLEPYGEITNTTQKARWEPALKSLISDGFLTPIEAGHQTWAYALTEKGFAAVQE